MIKDKIAIITGASSGIGFATALALSKAGVKVAIGARRVERLEDLAKKISADGGEVFYQKIGCYTKDLNVKILLKQF